MKLNNQRYNVAQNSSFSETRSYFMEKMSSGFPSNVLRLLCLNSVIYGGSLMKHVAVCRLQLQLQQQGLLLFCPAVTGGLACLQKEVRGHQNQS